MRRADKRHSVCFLGSDSNPNSTTNPNPDPNPNQVCFFGSDTNGLRRRALHALRNVPGAVLHLEP